MLKLAKMANIVASIFSGHIFDIKTMLGMDAIIPTIAVLGVAFGSLIGVAIFVEVIFARAGLGMLVFDAIQARNYPLVRGGVLAIAILFVLANLVADLTYQIVDPRIRARSGGGR